MGPISKISKDLIVALTNREWNNMKSEIDKPQTKENIQLFLDAVDSGNMKEVKRLLPLLDPAFNNSVALRLAVEQDHVTLVQLLLPVSDPKANESEALRIAVRRGHTKMVELLAPVSAAKVCANMCLRLASANGLREIAEILLPYSDPQDNQCAALQQAVIYRHKELIELLLPVSDYRLVVDVFQNQKCSALAEDLKKYIEDYEIKQQKDRLESAINTINKPKVPATKRKI